MTSQAFKDNYKLIDWSKPLPRRERRYIPPARSSLPCPMLIRDEMPPVKSMADGKMYDSKAAIRAEYKRLGFVEVGDDPARFRQKPKVEPDRTEIRETLEKAKSRVGV